MMTYDLMLEFLKHELKLFKASFYIYEGEHIVNRIENSIYNREEMIRRNSHFLDLVLSEEPINYFIENNLFIVGAVKKTDSPYTVLIGPFLLGDQVDSVAWEVFHRHSSSFETLEETQKALLTLTRISIDRFFNLLSSVYIALNHQPASLNVPASLEQVAELSTSVDKTLTELSEEQAFEPLQRAYSIEYERKLVFAIKNGLLDRIDKLEQESDIGKLGASSSNNLRRFKNLLLALNSICLRAAIEGGLFEETAYNLGDVFSRMIESAKDMTDLHTTSALIKREYCKQVHALRDRKIEDPLVIRATKYIYANIHSRITAKEIAARIGVTPQHLSARFAQALHCSIPSFILQQKITEAKQLLRFSDKSLSEISFMLSFSSQSYFQTQFKKVVGMTPLEYRNEKTKGMR